MAAKDSTRRLRKEFRSITREPPPHITARPLPSNILKWYFVLEGPRGTPYEGGIFMGRLIFPVSYPYKPPAVYMITPQGRFRTNTKLCLSMSDYHPETWNPLWCVSAVLTGLLSFMLGDEPTVGSITTSLPQKRQFAQESHRFNRSDKIFQELFPDFLREDSAPLPPIPTQAVPREPVRQSVTRNRQEPEGESLLSLILWLFVFVLMLFFIVKFITNSS